ncbi:MAG: META domain-containing protein [Actinomycetota bacterium]
MVRRGSDGFGASGPDKVFGGYPSAGSDRVVGVTDHSDLTQAPGLAQVSEPFAAPAASAATHQPNRRRTAYLRRTLFAGVAALAVGLFLRWLSPFDEPATLDEARIEGRWTLQEINGVVVGGGQGGADESWVRLEDGRLSGQMGCTWWQGDYRIVDASIQLGNLGESLGFCDGGIGEGGDVLFAETVRDFAGAERIDVFVDGEHLVWLISGREAVFVRHGIG